MKTCSLSTAQTTETRTLMADVAKWMSAVLEEEITPRQARCILHACLAVLVSVFSAGMPLLFHLIAIAWMGLAVLQCKWAGLKSNS